MGGSRRQTTIDRSTDGIEGIEHAQDASTSPAAGRRAKASPDRLRGRPSSDRAYVSVDRASDW